MDDSITKPPRNQPHFATITLEGGPHDGQMCQVPADQDSVTFYHNGTPHRYERFNRRPVMFHETLIASRLGGGRNG